MNVLQKRSLKKKNAPSDLTCYPIVRGNCLPILACANKKKSGSNGRLSKHANQFLEGTFNHTNKFLILFTMLIEKLCFNFILKIQCSSNFGYVNLIIYNMYSLLLVIHS